MELTQKEGKILLLFERKCDIKQKKVGTTRKERVIHNIGSTRRLSLNEIIMGKQSITKLSTYLGRFTYLELQILEAILQPHTH